jgi:fructoselysine 6-phosphate deglycase
MHEDKQALVKRQIEGLADAVRGRKIENVYFVSCGGSLATLYPGKYIMERESAKVSTGCYSSNEFLCDPPARLGEKALVVLNSQGGGTRETVAAAEMARKKGALTAAFTTAPGSPIEKTVEYIIYYYDNPADPYPMILSIYPEVYMTVFAVLDALEGSAKLADMEDTLKKLEPAFERIKKQYAAAAREFAQKHRTEPLIYTTAAGLDCSIAYVLTTCLIMESLWLDSSLLHAGEFFHGPFEAVDKETPVFAFLGLGKTRPVEERAVLFLQRVTDKLTVLDAKAFDLGEMIPWTREWVAPLVMNALAAYYCSELAWLKGHPISSRRYMGVEKY